MGLTAQTTDGDGDAEAALLLPTPETVATTSSNKVPEDSFHLAYIIYFTLGFGFLLPWNAFITAVDYFSYIYPDASVDRIFAVVYMMVALVSLLFIIFYSHKSDAYFRINLGLVLFVISLLVVPITDAVYIKGRVGLYDGFYVAVAALGLSGLADALVQGGIIGSAGELPERYMQAVVAGTAGSGKVFSLISNLGLFFSDFFGSNLETKFWVFFLLDFGSWVLFQFVNFVIKNCFFRNWVGFYLRLSSSRLAILSIGFHFRSIVL